MPAIKARKQADGSTRYTAVVRIPMHDITWFAIHSARRESEICRLEWADSHHRGRTGLVRDAKHPRYKEGNHRRFKFTAEAWEIVERQPKTSEYIFPYDPKSADILGKKAQNEVAVQPCSSQTAFPRRQPARLPESLGHGRTHRAGVSGFAGRERQAQILVDAHSVLLDFANRKGLIDDGTAAATRAELARLSNVLPFACSRRDLMLLIGPQTLDQCHERDEQGRRRLTVTLSNEDALESLARSLAVLLC